MLSYLYWCHRNNSWDAICRNEESEAAFIEGEIWLLNTYVVAPVAITSCNRTGTDYTLEYCRDTPPDLLRKLLKK